MSDVKIGRKGLTAHGHSETQNKKTTGHVSNKWGNDCHISKVLSM